MNSGNERLRPKTNQLASSIFVVDDDVDLLRSMDAMLSDACFQVSRFTTAEQFLESLSARQQGCLLTDVCLPGMNGLELQEKLQERNRIMTVIVMSGHADVPLAVRALKAGALEILEKPFSRDKLIQCVQIAMSVSAQRAVQVLNSEEVARKLATLSERERSVLSFIVKGHSSKEIARVLSISPRTVEVYRARMMEKLDVSNVIELINIANSVKTNS